MKRVFGAAVLAAVCLIAGNAVAMPKEGCGGECRSCHTLTVHEADGLLKGLAVGKVIRVNEPPIKGLWQVELEKEGKKAFAYVDYDKKHIIPGAIFTIATRQPIPLVGEGTPPQQKPKKVKFSTIPLGDSIVLGDPQAKKRLIVFTDPDCPFCARLHAELKKLLETEKVAIYVKFLPLKMHPTAYDKARVIMQGPDSAKLLDNAFSGRPIPAVTPQTPSRGVDESMALAGRLGITATPTMVFPDGTIHAGAMPAEEIEKMLAKGGKKKK